MDSLSSVIKVLFCKYHVHYLLNKYLNFSNEFFKR